MSHTPVLLHEVIECLDPKPGEFIIDGTIDGGGHALRILEKISPGGMLAGIDWDAEMLAQCRAQISHSTHSTVVQGGEQSRTTNSGQANREKVILIHGNYADLPEILKRRHLPKADGLLLDLGFSTEHIEQSGRGFSFQRDEPLLMTYDKNGKPVRELLERMSEQKLAQIIRIFGEERFAGRIARAIVAQERIAPIRTTFELRDAIQGAVPRGYERGRMHPATRTFQALRIYANEELENLKRVLSRLSEILMPGARIAAISFHSLEDRIVKQSFRSMEQQGALKILTKKPVRPQIQEIKKNPRSRSAKLRAAVLSF